MRALRKLEFGVPVRALGVGGDDGLVTVLVQTVPETSTGRRPVRQLVSAYVALTKPRIIELLLVTTVPAMILARRGMPSWWLVVATLVGGTDRKSTRLNSSH